MDKKLIEEDFITKVKVKWDGGGFAYSYLCKENKSDVEYKESWCDLRVDKNKKQQLNQINIKESRRRKT